MISQRFVKYFGKILNFLEFTHTMPFYFDHGTCRMLVTSNKRHNLVHNFFISIVVFYCAFSAFRLLTELHTSFESDYIGLTVVSVWILVYLWELVLHACLATKKKDMAWLFNQIVDLDLTLTKTSQSEAISVIPEAIIVICVYMGFLAILMWTTVFFFTATKRGYLYSVVPVEFQTLSVFSLFLVFEFFSKFQACATVLWDLMFFEITTVVSCHWIKNILSMPKPLRQKIRDYKFLNVLSNYINASNSTVKFPLIIAIMFFLLCIGIYGAVRLVGQISAQIYIMFPIIINNASLISALILLPAAQQHKLSVNNLDRIRYLKDSLGRNIPSRETRREMKSLRTFGVTFGIFRIVKYSYAAQFIMAVSNAALSLLVAFPNAN